MRTRPPSHVATTLLAALAALALAVPSAAHAQVSGEANILKHMARGVAETKVGDWVTYKMVGGAQNRVYYWRAAIVGEEKDQKGRDAVWVEVDLGTHHAMKAPVMQVKLLVARGALDKGDAITRVFMAMGVEKTRELEPAAVEKIFGGKPAEPEPMTDADAAQLRKLETTVRALPDQRLMTLAGTVSAVPVEVRVRSTVLKRIWMSNEVPILHLAKMEIPAIGHTLEVRDYGRDARPQMRLPLPDAPRLSIDNLPESVLAPSREMMSLVTGGGP